MYPITDFIGFQLSFNTGSAFSLPIPIWFTATIGVVIALVLLLGPISKKFKSISRGEHYLLAVITAGVLGNTIDRIFYGKVIDFIKIGSWPIFNLADTYLTTSVIIIIFHQLVIYKKTK